MQRPLNWKQKRIEGLYVMDSEWDIRVTFKHMEQLSDLLLRLQALVTTYNPVWLLVGGVEQAKKTDEVPLSSMGHAFKPHVHIAIIFNKHHMQMEVKNMLNIALDATGNYCQPRQARLAKHAHWTYFGWRQHHIKPRTKLTEAELLDLKLLVDPWLLMEHGQPPEDNYLLNKNELMRVAYLYCDEHWMQWIKNKISDAKPMKLPKFKQPVERASRAKVHAILKGRKKVGRTNEQMIKAKDRLSTWMQKAAQAEPDSTEQLRAIEVIGRIRKDYFDEQSNSQLNNN